MNEKIPDQRLEQMIEKQRQRFLERGSVEEKFRAGEAENRIQANTTDKSFKIYNETDIGNVIVKILVIDDDDQIRGMLKELLELEGFEVLEAKNGEEGVKLFFENPVHLIITDIIMPIKDGIETILDIKEAYPDAKIIAVSGGGWYGTAIEFDMAQKLGARTLKKPFQKKEILNMIEELLQYPYTSFSMPIFPRKITDTNT